MQKLERREIDLWPIVEAVVGELQPVISASSVEIVNNVPADFVSLPMLVCYRVLSKTRSRSPSTARHVASCAFEAIDDAGSGVECRVQHSGPPLSPEAASALFDDGNSHEHAENDIGLSLALVKQVIEAHHGEIQAYSSDGQGVTIEFHLPTAEKAS